MKQTAKRLLGGHVFGTLTQEEQRELHRTALDDQEVFDALVDDEPLREALADPVVRRDLLELLDKPTILDRLRGWLSQPATLGHLSAATLAMFLALAGWQLVPQRATKGVPVAAAPTLPAAAPADWRIAFFTLPLRSVIPGRIDGDPPAFRVTAGAAANVLVLERNPGGTVEQLFPPPGGSSAVGPDKPVAVTASLAPGAHRLRLVICPPDVEPLSLDSRSLPTLGARLGVVERTYTVSAGGKTP
jgi:hypothetical protein